MMRATQSGTSLIQGMVVMAIVAVTALFAAPLYYRLISDRHVVSYTNDLVGTLQTSRRLAIKTLSAVSLCSSDNGRTCTNTPWSQGYIAFSDGGQPGVVDGFDNIVVSVPASKVSLEVVLSGATQVRFLSTGGLVADAHSDSDRAGEEKESPPTMIAGLLEALSPIATAEAAETLSMAEPESSGNQPVAFLICSGGIGRTVQVTAIGRLETTAVSCR